jgi:hypothetical protein
VLNPLPGGGSSNALQFQIDTAGSGSPVFTTNNGSVVPGATTNFPVTLPSGATSVSVSCLNLPPGASCSYSAASSSVTISTSSNTPAGTYQVIVVFTETLPGAAAALLLPIFILPLYTIAKRRGAQRLWFVLCIAVVISFTVSVMGCGGGGGGAPVQQTHQVTSSGTITLIVR